MLKKILLIVFTVISVSFSQEQFKSEKYGFEITFPKFWNVKEGTSAMVAVLASSGDITSINVVVKENESIGNVTVDEVNIEKFKDDLVSKYSAAFANFKELDYGKTTVNGYNALFFSYNCDIADKVLKAKQYFIFNNAKMYVISTGCPDLESIQNESMFNDCLNTFKFIN
jgi:hypothetical protein